MIYAQLKYFSLLFWNFYVCVWYSAMQNLIQCRHAHCTLRNHLPHTSYVMRQVIRPIFSSIIFEFVRWQCVFTWWVIHIIHIFFSNTLFIHKILIYFLIPFKWKFQLHINTKKLINNLTDIKAFNIKAFNLWK